MDKPIQILREALVSPKYMHGKELRVFAIAACHGLDIEARAAARATLVNPILEAEFGPGLKNLTGVIFTRLPYYCEACLKCTCEVLAWFQSNPLPMPPHHRHA